jgi:HEAT repeat protein
MTPEAHDARTDHEELESWLYDAIEGRGPQLLDTLLRHVRHSDPEIRSTVAFGLGEIHDDRAIDPLIRMVDGDSSEEVRDEALRALESYRDPRILDCLLREARRPKRSRPPRQVVAKQLRYYDCEPAIDALTELLYDADEFVRSDALESLLILRPDRRETWERLYRDA